MADKDEYVPHQEEGAAADEPGMLVPAMPKNCLDSDLEN